MKRQGGGRAPKPGAGVKCFRWRVYTGSPRGKPAPHLELIFSRFGTAEIEGW
jgi:hypothetical protein